MERPTEILGPQGPIAERKEGYTPRPAQVQMSEAVCDAIEDSTELIVEAPTGCGKSFAYLIPAIEQAKAKGLTIVVATANIALQEQLVNKDLPFLKEVLGGFDFGLAKGLNNYLCALEHEGQAGAAPPTGSERDVWEQVRDWGFETATGDKSELPFEPSYDVWSKFSTTSDECDRHKCAFFEQCFVMKAKARLAQARVIVSNYHLLFADLAAGMGTVLPPYQVLLCDEAHELPDIARDFLGFQISRMSFYAATKGKRLDGELRDRVRAQADDLFQDLDDFFSESSPHILADASVWANYRELPADLKRCAQDLRDQMMGPPEEDKDARQLERKAKRLDRLGDRLEETMTFADKENGVYFTEADRLPSGERRMLVRKRLIKVGELLRDLLFKRVRSAVITSATLQAGGDFKYIAAETGLATARTLEVDSPFNMSRQCQVFVPDTMPDPRDNKDGKWLDAVAEHAITTVRMTRGRTLCLFTSYRSIEHTYRAMMAANLPYRVLRQGDAPRTKLVEMFKADPSSVLLGTKSFWAGVDVPGEALSCVVMDKLPFEQITEPVLQMIQERDRGWFGSHYLPRAIIQFKQGVGRLIRSSTDFGAVVILDRRVIDKGYGRSFIRSIPGLDNFDDDLQALQGVFG